MYVTLAHCYYHVSDILDFPIFIHWAFGIALYRMPSIMESILQFIWFWPISCVNPIFEVEHTAVLPHTVHSTS